MLHLRNMNRQLLIAVLLAIFLFSTLAGAVAAAEMRGGEVVTVGENEVIDDDLFITGATVVVNGVINGDLVAAGSQVTINGEVKGSLMVAGQTLLLNGKVGGTVYSGGATLTVGRDAQVGRSVVFGGYNLRTEPGSVVGRDVIVGGYQAILNGSIERDLYASLGALEIYGLIGRNVEAVVEPPTVGVMPPFFGMFGGQPMPPAVQPGLRVAPEAQIQGNLHYVSPVEQSGTIAASPEGETIFTPPTVATVQAPPVAPPNPILSWLLERVREIVALFVLGALALWLLPGAMNSMDESIREHPWLSGAWGLLIVVVGYAGVFVLTIFLIALVVGLANITLGGLAAAVFWVGATALALAFALFSVMVAYGSKIVVIHALSRWAMEKLNPGWTGYRWLTMLLGIVVYALLVSIPWIGTLIAGIVTLIGLGGIWLSLRTRFTKTQPAAPQLVLTPA